MRISSSINPLLSVISTIFLLVIFFIGYNNFLLDKSLLALDVSLQSLKAGDTLGVGLLLNIENSAEVAKDNFDESLMARLDYLSTTISERATTKDVQIVLSDLM